MPTEDSRSGPIPGRGEEPTEVGRASRRRDGDGTDFDPDRTIDGGSARPPDPTLPAPADAETIAPTDTGGPALADGRPGGASMRGARVPGYEILDELGRGGMGVVYKARQVGLNRIVALKTILAGAYAGAGDLQRFRVEAEAIAQLQHPNIVQIHDIGEVDGLPFFSLEYLEGGGLDRRLDGTPLKPDEAARLVRTLAGAVHAAHLKGVVHRDLKPGNILMAADGTPKITDFGLAKRLDSAAGQTQSGSILGSPSYMAPEQAAGRIDAVGPLADVYALGAVLYELLTGRPPFRGATPLDTLAQVVASDPVAPGRLVPGLPKDIETIALKCLEKDLARRYPDAMALADDLRRFLDGEPILARPVGPARRALKWVRRRPGIAAMLALLAVVTWVGFSAVVYEWRRAERQKDRAEEQKDRAERQKARAERALSLAEERKTEADAQRAAAVSEKARADAQLYAASIALAYEQWLAGDVARARQLLEGCPARSRGWEWDYLDKLCHDDRLTLRGHASWVLRAGFRGDGQRVASIGLTRPQGSEGTVRTWDAETGAPVKTFDAKGTGLALGADGRLAAVGSGDSVTVYDLEGDGEPRTFHGRGGAQFLGSINSDGAFRPDGRRFAAGATDNAVYVWDLDRGEPARRLEGHHARPMCVAYSLDGRRIASAASAPSLFRSSANAEAPEGAPAEIIVWDDSDGSIARRWAIPDAGAHRLAFAPGGARLASAGMDGIIRVWDPANGRELAAMAGHKGFVYGVAFSPDGRRLASAGWDHAVKLWDVDSGRERATLRGHELFVFDVAFAPGGARLASAGMDGTVKVWDLSALAPGGDASSDESSQAYVALLGRGGPVSSVAFSPDGTRLATGDWGGAIRIWDRATRRPIRTYRGHSTAISTIEFRRDGRRIVSASGGMLALGPGEAKVWDPETGADVATMHAGAGPVIAARFSPDGTRVVSAVGAITYLLKPGEVKLWDAETGRGLATVVKSPAGILDVAFDAGGRRVAVARFERGLARLDAATGAPTGPPLGPERSYRAVAFSRDESKVAAAGLDGAIVVWDAARGKELWKLPGHTLGSYSLAFDPSGRRLASSGADAAVKVWDMDTGLELLTLRHHDHEVYALAFDPDGHVLATSGFDGTVKLHEARTAPLPETDDWPVVFADAFDRAEVGDRWDTPQGRWSIAGGSIRGVLQPDQDNPARATISPRGLKLPQSVEVRFACRTPDRLVVEAKLLGGGPFEGLLAGLTNRPHFGLRGGESGAMLMVMSGTFQTAGANTSFALTPGVRHRVRLLREPRRMTLFVDGARVVSSRVPALEAPTLQLQGVWGEVGAVVEFDDVEVRAPRTPAP